jgi:uncharacterized protein YebE (UPF0316 family)
MDSVRSVRNVIVYALTYCAFIVLACLLWRKPYLLAAGYVVISLLLLKARQAADLVTYAFGFFLGPLTEVICIKSGAWTYSEALVIPIWLPFAWGIAGLGILRGVNLVLLIQPERSSGADK